MDCPHRDGIIDKIAVLNGDVKIVMERTGRHDVEIRALDCKHSDMFTLINGYYKELIPLLGNINGSLGTLTERVTLNGDLLETHVQENKEFLEEYCELYAEVVGFKWFTVPLNKWQKKLPWVVAVLGMVAIGAFIVPYEITTKGLVVIKKVIEWFK